MNRFILNKEDTILMVIDIQEKLGTVMKDLDRVVKNTNILITACKEMNMPAIVTEQYPKGIGPTVSEIKENLREDMTIFEKNSFSACTDEVKEYLEKTGKKKVIITGMETHICVFQTTRALLNDGYQVFIARDAVVSRTDENYLNGLDMMKDAGAVISNTETIIFDLLKVSGTPEFKVLSKLIK